MCKVFKYIISYNKSILVNIFLLSEKVPFLPCLLWILLSALCDVWACLHEPGPWWFYYLSPYTAHRCPVSSALATYDPHPPPKCLLRQHKYFRSTSEWKIPSSFNSTLLQNNFKSAFGSGSAPLLPRQSAPLTLPTLSQSPLPHFWRPISDCQTLERSWLKRILSFCSHLNCVLDFYPKEEV